MKNPKIYTKPTEPRIIMVEDREGTERLSFPGEDVRKW